MSSTLRLNSSKEPVLRLNIALHPILASYTIGTVALRWTKHAAERSMSKGLPLSYSLSTPAQSIVEAEFSFKRLTKVVVRVPFDATSDACYVLVPSGDAGTWLVVTCWTNARGDTHKTLDVSRLGKVA